jgi:hypothetical protein
VNLVAVTMVAVTIRRMGEPCEPGGGYYGGGYY